MDAICLFILIVVNVCYCRPQNKANDILHYENVALPDGYKFEYETADGTKRSEVGTLNLKQTFDVIGYYQYIDPDGNTHIVNYTADENGYRPRVGGTKPATGGQGGGGGVAFGAPAVQFISSAAIASLAGG